MDGVPGRLDVLQSRQRGDGLQLPRTGDLAYVYPFAEYAIVSITDGDPRIEFCQVPYDVDTLDAAARASGHPYGAALAARHRPRPSVAGARDSEGIVEE